MIVVGSEEETRPDHHQQQTNPTPRRVAARRRAWPQRQRRGQRPQTAEQLAALRGVVRLAGREREGYRRASICGNHMNLGGPSAARFADRLRTVFFNAPVPSG